MEFLPRQQLIENGIISASYKELSESLTMHVHDFYEIEFIIHGTGTYIIDGTAYPIHDNMLFFMSPAAFHAFENIEAKIINIMFPCSICNTETMFQLFFSNTNNVFIDEENILIEKLLDEVVVGCQNGNYNYAVHFLQSLLYKLNTLTPFSKKQPASYVQSTIIYITENFRENITLSDAATHVGIVPAYLSTLFLKETGINFKTYLDNIRFDHATKLLTFSNISIADVCTQSGFLDYANFSRRFKEKYKLTPKVYRTAHQMKQ